MARASERHQLGASQNGDGDVDLLRAAPVLARLAFAAWVRTTGWTVQTSVTVSTRVVRGAANGESPAELIRDVEDELRQYLRRLLGVDAEGNATDDPDPVDAEVVE